MSIDSISEKIQRNFLQDPEFIILSDHKKRYRWKDLQSLVEFYDSIILKEKRKCLAFFTDRSIATVAIIIACIRNNITFVPISKNQPEERIRDIVFQISETEVLELSENNFVKILESGGQTATNFENILYVLFTSGSTGSPKGVKITENNLLNTLAWSDDIFAWRRNDVIGIVTPFYFDISIFDLILSLTKQIRFHIFSQINNHLEFFHELNSSEVTSIFSTPALFSNISKLDQPSYIKSSRLRRIISGGDFFPSPDILYWKSKFPELEIYNVWGPTETSIVNTAHLIDREDMDRLKNGKPISIGKSTPKMEVIICDSSNDEISLISTDCLVGELMVQGESVGMGYLNQDELTSKNFFTFLGKRTYRTGDFGFKEKGEIFMTNRDAHLIKYQGFRIDPREVETHLSGLKGIKNSCLILADRINENSELVLIVEADSNFESNVFYIKKFLRNKVPAYMVPKKIVYVDQIPFNQNGKLDRKKCQSIYVTEYF